MITVNGTDRVQREIDPTGLSPKQIQFIQETNDHPDFDFFCSSWDRSDCEGYKGPVTLIYFTKDGCLHAVKISVTGRVLAEAHPTQVRLGQEL